MTEETPTIRVRYKDSGRVTTINLSDFDIAVHESADQPETVVFDRKAAFEALEAAGVKVAKNTSDAKLKELLEAQEQVTLRIEQDQETGKFFVIKGKEVLPESYDTKEDAETVLALIGGE